MSAVKGTEFFSDRKSYITLRGRWFYIIVLNIHVPIEDKTDSVNGSFYKELERMFDKCPKRHMKILFNAKWAGMAVSN
jgi:hypothetical protein